jgi:tetratricopeptide (TPR) repeat protein
MRSNLFRLAPIVVLTLLAACVAHDKQGDKYAAVGDWKNAWVNYREAAARKPNDPVLQQKYENARQQAIATSVAQANTCASQRAWDCALNEADFVLTVDPSRGDMADVRRRAGTEVALARLAQVQGEVVAGRLQQAAGLIQQAQRLSEDPAVASEARRAIQIYSSGVADESDKLRAAHRYADAMALLQTGAAIDPGLRSRLDATSREYESWKAAEHDRFMAEGEGHLSAGRWADAQASFRAAQQLRGDERARAFEQYAHQMQAGDEAVKRSDWNGATKAFREAAALRVDRGYAEEMAAKVQVRPYAVSLKTVVVTPLRPNRTPWVGPHDRRLDRIQMILAERWTDPLAGKVLLVLNDTPPANRPNLVVEVTLPNGQRLVTGDDRAIYSTPRAVFVIAANGFDQGKVVFRVFHRLPAGQTEDIGYAETTVGELVSKRALLLQDRAIGAIELTVDSAEGSRAGTFTGLTQVTPPPSAPPPPAPVKTSPPPPTRPGTGTRR